MNLGVAPAEHHASFRDRRGAVDEIFGVVNPDPFAGGGIHAMHLVVVAAHEDAIPCGACGPIGSPWDLVAAWIFPLERACSVIQRIKLAVARSNVDHAVAHQRRRLHAISGLKAPEQPARGEIERGNHSVIGTDEHFVVVDGRRRFDRAARLMGPAQLEGGVQAAMRHACQILRPSEHRP